MLGHLDPWHWLKSRVPTNLLRRGSSRSSPHTFTAICMAVGFGIASAPTQGVSQQPNSTSATPAETPQSDSDWHYQFTLFHYLLEQQGLTTVNSLVELRESQDRAIVISLGQQNTRVWQREFRPLIGRVAFLVASDYPFELSGFFRIAQGPVFANANANAISYMGHPDCLTLPIAEDSQKTIRGINSVVLNRAGWIEIERAARQNWETIGRFPQSIAPDPAKGSPWMVRGNFGDSPDTAPMFVLSDQSVLSNGMLWHGENLLLALRIIEQLSSDGRDRVAVIINGRIHGESPKLTNPPPDELPQPEQLPQLPDSPPPPPTPDELLDIANTVIAKIEDADLLNEMLADQPRRILPPYYRRLLLVAFAGFLLAGAVYLFSLQDQRKTNTQQILLEGAGLVPQRARTENNQAPETPEERGLVANAMIRETFVQMTGSEDKEVWERWLAQAELQSVGIGNSPGKHLLHLVGMDPIPPTSKEKLFSIGSDLLTMKTTLAQSRTKG